MLRAMNELSMRVRIRRVSFWVALAVCGLTGMPVEAKSKKEEPPKVSVLMKEANDLMSQAQSSYVDGEAKEAIELYRKALAEIVRVERENPNRVASAEFAPVRFRKALCETEIDRILIEEVSASSRTVAVSDTRALEEKRKKSARWVELCAFPPNSLSHVSATIFLSASDTGTSVCGLTRPISMS